MAPDVPFFYNIEYFISEIIACVAVPLFFLISGFLFFYRLRGFNHAVYLSKLRKRFWSLFVPYLFWSFFAVFVTLAIQLCVPSLLSGEAKHVVSWTASDWVSAIWGTISTQYSTLVSKGLNGSSVFLPLVYLAVKYLKICGLLVLGLLYISGT